MAVFRTLSLFNIALWSTLATFAWTEATHAQLVIPPVDPDFVEIQLFDVDAGKPINDKGVTKCKVDLDAKGMAGKRFLQPKKLEFQPRARISVVGQDSSIGTTCSQVFDIDVEIKLGAPRLVTFSCHLLATTEEQEVSEIRASLAISGIPGNQLGCEVWHLEWKYGKRYDTDSMDRQTQCIDGNTMLSAPLKLRVSFDARIKVFQTEKKHRLSTMILRNESIGVIEIGERC